MIKTSTNPFFSTTISIIGKKEKLIYRFLREPKDFSWDETLSLMSLLGFEWRQNAGSHGRFVFLKDSSNSIMLCRPHPTPILKRWALRSLKEQLLKMELL